MRHLAFDIGAESGRAVVGELIQQRLKTTEVHRFPNAPVQVDGTLRWDTERLLSEIRTGIGKAGNAGSVAIDTWGVDFALLDENDELVEQPYCYRDSRTDGVMEKIFERVSREEIYRQTGIQFMQFNSLFQLCATAPETLNKARTFLTIPDYLNYRLGGKARACEFTNATTTQCFNPTTGAWAYDLLDTLQIPQHIFPTIVEPGTKLGQIGNADLIAPACHDTGSAVAAVPAEGKDFAWISSGTWSIMGVETPIPIIDERTLNANFTNEGGVGGTYRLCKNVMGLWIVQQCRATWAAAGQAFSYEELAEMAEQAESGLALFDVDDPECLKPCDMPALIRKLLAKSGQPAPEAPGQLIRIVLESLAAKYAQHLTTLEELTGRKLTSIHVIGGGSQNHLLNRLTAEACNRPVIAGPAEATAIGNILMQMLAMGEIDSVAAGRKLVKESFQTVRFQ